MKRRKTEVVIPSRRALQFDQYLFSHIDRVELTRRIISHRLKSTKLVGIVRKPKTKVSSVALLQEKILVSGDVYGNIYVHDTKHNDRSLVHKTKVEEEILDIHPNGDSMLCITYSGTCGILKLESGNSLKNSLYVNLFGGDILLTKPCSDISTDNSRVFAISCDKQIKIFDERCINAIAFSTSTPFFLNSVRFGPSSHTLLVSSLESVKFGVIDVRKIPDMSNIFATVFEAGVEAGSKWNKYTGCYEAPFTQHSKPVECVQMAGLRALSSVGNTHKIWSLESGQGVCSLGLAFPTPQQTKVLPCVTRNLPSMYSVDGSHVFEWDTSSFDDQGPVNTFCLPTDCTSTCINVDPFGNAICVGDLDGNLFLWDADC